jgi:hypothetical protein
MTSPPTFDEGVLVQGARALLTARLYSMSFVSLNPLLKLSESGGS